MVNFGFNSANLLGIFLAVAGAALYFIRTIRPELSRDHDIFFAAVGLLCGLILLFHGWRLDPILQFSQFLLIGSAIFFAIETLRLRGSTTEQARRNSPIVDEERSVSRVYRAQLDQLEGYEDEQREDNPRLRGYVDPQARNTKTRRPPESSRPSNRSTKRPPSDPYYDAWGDSTGDVPRSQPRKTKSSRSRKPETETPPRTRRKPPSRPSSQDYDYYSDYPDSTPSDYVDYQPIDSPGVPKDKEPRERGRKPNSQPQSNFDY